MCHLGFCCDRCKNENFFFSFSSSTSFILSYFLLKINSLGSSENNS